MSSYCAVLPNDSNIKTAVLKELFFWRTPKNGKTAEASILPINPWVDAKSSKNTAQVKGSMDNLAFSTQDKFFPVYHTQEKMQRKKINKSWVINISAIV